MGINRSNISSSNIETNTDVVIEVVYTVPRTSSPLDTPMTPNKLFGFYDASQGAVRLYVSDDSGLNILPVQ